MVFNRISITGQRGAAMVEFAITFLVYLFFIFAIIQFALVIFKAAQLAEATRAGARYAIVNNPACDIFGKGVGETCPDGPLDCDSDSATYHPTIDISISSCPNPVPATDDKCKIVEEMDRIMMGRTSILAGTGKVNIRYSCSDVGDSKLPYVVPLTTISADDVQEHMPLFGTTITLPSFSTSRTGEDLFNQ